MFTSIIKPLQEDGKNLLALEVSPGRSTPYYYKADGVMEAYIRVGNESVVAPDYSEFIRNNSKVRFVKKAQYRVDKPDYAERAVTEALVNALIHRDYIVLGSEIHIDMFDDRVEITSPGGMFGGGSIQEYDIYSIRSMRRTPVIADLFHRMKYMERRGSGLRKIVSETEKLPGYTEAYKPEFSSTATDFRVILKSVDKCFHNQHLLYLYILTDLTFFLTLSIIYTCRLYNRQIILCCCLFNIHKQTVEFRRNIWRIVKNQTVAFE